MNDLRTAAQQALEALHVVLKDDYRLPYEKIVAATDALKAALAEPVLNPAPGYCKHCKQYTIEEPLPAEPVQEPVATVTECEACFTPDVCQLRGICDHYAASQLRIAAPPQREPEPVQEPVAWRTFDGEGGWDYRDYENNEDYHKQWIERNGDRYAHWVEPLYNRVQKS